jgi:ferric-dicitrate binding protein FerR (iron transport regulator)
MTPEAVQLLLDRYVSEELSREEFFALWETLSQDEFRPQWQQQVESLLQSGGYDELASKEQQAMILAAILQQPKASAPVISLARRFRWWAAAAVVLGLALTGYWWSQNREKPILVQQKKPLDPQPGRQGAVLTLADGAQLVLDSMHNGLIATQNGAKVELNDNKVSYAPADKTSAAVVYNLLSTPNGRQFHVQLPDGTGVWLNAASSIRYPTVFSEKERKVTITGEAYLEVAKNKGKPFIVDINGKTTVEVLGTSFNVNAYTDEPYINTTLLEGSIQVVSQPVIAGAAGHKRTIVLKPGQQLRTSDQEMKLSDNADLKMAVAWKEGSFQFNYTKLDEILRQFARWYDVKVIYEQKTPNFVLSGAIRRDFTLSEALLTLEKMGLHYKIEEGKLIILP